MRPVLIALMGLAAALFYGVLAYVLTGTWHPAHMFTLLVLVILVAAGIRRRLIELPPEDVRAASEGAEEQSPTIEEKEATDEKADEGEPSQGNIEPPETEKAIKVDENIISQPIPTEYVPVEVVTESPEALWEKARTIPHSVIPDFEEDEEYLSILYASAEGGYVPALAKLGDYALRKGLFVEAYFWTVMAKCRQIAQDKSKSDLIGEIEGMLRTIRREWAAAGAPLEFENEYMAFPEERGELGRAFLRIDSGLDVTVTKAIVHELALQGNPDAQLYEEKNR